MVISKPKLAVILAACIVLDVAGGATIRRTATYLLVPKRGVTLDVFDTLSVGMPQETAADLLWPGNLLRVGGEPHPPLSRGGLPRHGRHVVALENWPPLQLVLQTQDGVVTDGSANVDGQVVREHLRPRNPAIDTLRMLLRRLKDDAVLDVIELPCFLLTLTVLGVFVMVRGWLGKPVVRHVEPTFSGHRPHKMLSDPMAFVAGIGLVGGVEAAPEWPPCAGVCCRKVYDRRATFNAKSTPKPR